VSIGVALTVDSISMPIMAWKEGEWKAQGQEKRTKMFCVNQGGVARGQHLHANHGLERKSETHESGRKRLCQQGSERALARGQDAIRSISAQSHATARRKVSKRRN